METLIPVLTDAISSAAGQAFTLIGIVAGAAVPVAIAVWGARKAMRWFKSIAG